MTPKALSREIKFRAWNPSTKTYGYFEPFKRFELSAEPDYDGYMGKINTWRYKKGAMGDMGMYYEFSISHENVEDLVFQQYTGLLDKNGKEIYEGDIIKCKRGGIERNCKVIWEDHVVRNDYEGQYSDLNGYETFGGWKIVGINGLALAMHTGQFEVIGNIYENQELIN